MSPSRDESTTNATILQHGDWTTWTIEDGERLGRKRVASGWEQWRWQQEQQSIINVKLCISVGWNEQASVMEWWNLDVGRLLFWGDWGSTESELKHVLIRRRSNEIIIVSHLLSPIIFISRIIWAVVIILILDCTAMGGAPWGNEGGALATHWRGR